MNNSRFFVCLRSMQREFFVLNPNVTAHFFAIRRTIWQSSGGSSFLPGGSPLYYGRSSFSSGGNPFYCGRSPFSYGGSSFYPGRGSSSCGGSPVFCGGISFYSDRNSFIPGGIQYGHAGNPCAGGRKPLSVRGSGIHGVLSSG